MSTPAAFCGGGGGGGGRGRGRRSSSVVQFRVETPFHLLSDLFLLPHTLRF